MASPRQITSFVILVVALGVGLLVPVGQRADAATTPRAASGTASGYTLYSPLSGNCTYLVNSDGNVVHEWWSATKPGNNQRLLPNGDLLRAGELAGKEHLFSPYGYGGLIEEVKWNGDPVWKFKYADKSHMQHHDVTPLPNGDVLFLAWDRKTKEQAIAAGRDPAKLVDGELWPDTVVEYSPSLHKVVWKWSVWDHLIQDFDPTKANYGDVAAHPEKVDINYIDPATPGNADWNHANGLSYNPALDQIVLSSRALSEVWVIDHHTTTRQARGRAGDLLFRYGNPQTYRQSPADQQLYYQHDPEWIPSGYPGAGNFTVFSNGDLYHTSAVYEISPVEHKGHYVVRDGQFAATVETVYPQDPADAQFVESILISGAQRLANGDTLVTYGLSGRMLEVDPGGKVVWQYQNPYPIGLPDTATWPFSMQAVFKAHHYRANDPALRGRHLAKTVAPGKGPCAAQDGPSST